MISLDDQEWKGVKKKTIIIQSQDIFSELFKCTRGHRQLNWKCIFPIPIADSAFS